MTEHEKWVQYLSDLHSPGVLRIHYDELRAGLPPAMPPGEKQARMQAIEQILNIRPEGLQSPPAPKPKRR